MWKTTSAASRIKYRYVDRLLLSGGLFSTLALLDFCRLFITSVFNRILTVYQPFILKKSGVSRTAFFGSRLWQA